jgi:hypothetical protein
VARIDERVVAGLTKSASHATPVGLLKDGVGHESAILWSLTQSHYSESR